MAIRKKQQPGFEQALSELEGLVEQMERGDLSLEDSLRSFERGVELTRICREALGEAEQKVQILNTKTTEAPLEEFDRDE